MLVQELILIKF